MINPITLVDDIPPIQKPNMMHIHQASGYLQHGNEDIQLLANSYVLLWEAIRDSYYMDKITDIHEIAKYGELCGFTTPPPHLQKRNNDSFTQYGDI